MNEHLLNRESPPPPDAGSQVWSALALEHAHLAAGWLARSVKPDGSFHYLYNPATNRYDTSTYNDIRHAGATAALFRAAALPGGDRYQTAAESGLGYLLNASRSLPPGGKGYLHKRRVKLGGQAMALVALLERRRLSGDSAHDAVILEMATFLAAMEMPHERGQFFPSWDQANRKFLTTPDSSVYPGEALLALVRLSSHFPDGPWKALAERAAHHLLFVRDGDIVAAGRVPREDHWLTIALTEMDSVNAQPATDVIRLQAASMTASLNRFRRRRQQAEPGQNAAKETLAAVGMRLHAMAAVWSWAEGHDDPATAGQCRSAIEASLPVLIDAQYTPGNTTAFPQPDRAIGGWPIDDADSTIRLDTVHHGLAALTAAFALLDGGSAPPVEHASAPPGPALRPRSGLRANAQAVHDAAVRRGIPIREVDVVRERLELGTGAFQQRFWLLSSSKTTTHGVRIAHDKHLTRTLLAAAGIPVARGYPARTLPEALQLATSIGYPVVLKPRQANKGRDVYIELANATALEGAWELLARAAPPGGVIVEQFISGNEYRVLVVGGKVFAVNQRIPPTVTGDGVSTIRELVERENARPEREAVVSSTLRAIVIDDQTHELLSRDGLTIDSVLDQGRVQLVKRVSNVSAGGSTRDVTELAHPDAIWVAECAAKVTGLDIAGIDLIVPDISRSIWESGGAIIEVNSSPGLIDHLRPTAGTPRDVGAAIVDMLFPPGAPVRAPIVAILGAEPAEALARLLALALERAGRCPGMLVGHQVSIQNAHHRREQRGGLEGLALLMANPFVEVAIAAIDPAVVHDLSSELPYADLVIVAEDLAGSSTIASLVRSIPTPAAGWIVAAPGAEHLTRMVAVNIQVLPDDARDPSAAAVAAALGVLLQQDTA